MAQRCFIKEEDVKPLLDRGYSYQQIADALGYKKVSIGFFCRKHFGKLPDKGKFVRKNIPYTQEQKEIIFGTLLGDAGIYKRKHKKAKCETYFGRINHGELQLEYANYIRSFFDSSLVSDIRHYFTKGNNNTLVKRNRWHNSFDFKDNYALKELYDMFYINDGKKDVPMDLTLLTPRAMAFWFMDDGSCSNKHSVSIATMSFSISGLLRLQEYLLQTYNIKTIIRKDYTMYIMTQSAPIFYDLIKPYMHESLMYKLRKVNI